MVYHCDLHPGGAQELPVKLNVWFGRRNHVVLDKKLKLIVELNGMINNNSYVPIPISHSQRLSCRSRFHSSLWLCGFVRVRKGKSFFSPRHKDTEEKLLLPINCPGLTLLHEHFAEIQQVSPLQTGGRDQASDANELHSQRLSRRSRFHSSLWLCGFVRVRKGKSFFSPRHKDTEEKL